MWEGGGGVHGSHEALLLQAAGGVGAHGGDHGAHASALLPWLGPAAAAPPYMIPHVPPAPYGGEMPVPGGTFGIGGYCEGGGGLGNQYGLFGLEPPQQHAVAGGGGAASLQMGQHGLRVVSGLLRSLQAELGRMTAKALAASRSHSEAERRRRQRINGHLARLRSLLPNTTKTDKASLLAEVIEHVKELKRQTSAMMAATEEAEAGPAQQQLMPTEADELEVDAAADEEGRFVVRASLCCEDRPDLIPDIVRGLAALRLRARRAEIATLGGRVRNVLLITAVEEEDEEGGRDCGNDDGDDGCAASHRRHELFLVHFLSEKDDSKGNEAFRPSKKLSTSSSGGVKQGQIECAARHHSRHNGVVMMISKGMAGPPPSRSGPWCARI